MNATRGLLVLAGLVPMATGPLDILVDDASAAEVQPAGAPRTGLGAVHAGDAVAVHLSRTQTPVGAPHATPVVTRIDVSA